MKPNDDEQEDGASPRVYATPALEKGLDVIELLARQPAGLTKSQIARHLNRTVSEIFRMLICLESRRYISLRDGDRYVLTLKLLKLVQEYPPTERLTSEALPIMHHFCQQTLQSCHLGIVEDGMMVVLAQVNAPTPIGFFVKPGSTGDVMLSSTGYVILAFQDEARRERTLVDWRRNSGKKLPTNLDRHLQRIRQKGYEEIESYRVRGVVNITYPILDASGFALAALTVPYIQHLDATISQREVVSLLKESAAALTAAVGATF